MQPVYVDDNGTARFKKNALVRFLLDLGPFDMNKLAMLPNISREDREQFLQLIGYSVYGFGELSYVREETYGAAILLAEKALKEKKGDERQEREGRQASGESEE